MNLDQEMNPTNIPLEVTNDKSNKIKEKDLQKLETLLIKEEMKYY